MKENPSLTSRYSRFLVKQESCWADEDSIKASAHPVDLSSPAYTGAGIPLLFDNEKMYVDNSDGHTLIFGATGSKKSRLFVMPTINILIGAGETFIATDPKGELYDRTAGFAKEKGYKLVVINLRNIGFGDSWNPLELAYSLYQSKTPQRDKAVEILNDFIVTLAAPQADTTKDMFWVQSASLFALANLLLLMEMPREFCNTTSFAHLCLEENYNALLAVAASVPSDSLAGLCWRGIFSAPERTRQSIFVSLFAMIQPFLLSERLKQTLSDSSFCMRDLAAHKTAVYVIIPDEKTSMHFLATTFIKQVYETLISEAHKRPDRSLPVRCNFVLDEFSNIPKLGDFPQMCTAARSRNIRFFLAVQSLHQLKNKYGEDEATIRGNCDNWVFLTTREMALLQEISDLTGTVKNYQGSIRPLISPSELQRLSKVNGEALILHGREWPFVSRFPDIDDDAYACFKGYSAPAMHKVSAPPHCILSLKRVSDAIKNRTIPIPFSNKEGE